MDPFRYSEKFQVGMPERVPGFIPPDVNLGRSLIDSAVQDLEFHPRAEYFTRSLKRRGGSTLRIRFAGVGFGLDGLSSEDAALIRARFGVFVKEGEPLPGDARIEVLDADVPAFLRMNSTAGGPAEAYRLEQCWEGSRLIAYSYEFAGWFDREGLEGQLALVSCGTDMLQRSVENYLRSLTAHRVLERGGFLLHGAGVVRDGGAHVFFGPSGSGKTTVTVLSEGDLILGDDLILIQEQKEELRAWPVPFRGVFRESPVEEGSFPLLGFYRLVQAPSDFLETLSAARGVAELMGSLPFVMEGGSGSSALEAVGRAVARVPVHRLHFRKSPDFWRLLERKQEAAR
jgi:hypothetical protein